MTFLSNATKLYFLFHIYTFSWLVSKAHQTHAFLNDQPFVTLRTIKLLRVQKIFSSSEEDYDSDEDDIYNPPHNDWLEAELVLRNFPISPDPAHTPYHIAISTCRSLQLVDYPTKSSGLERCFPLFTWECRKTVTARRGGDTVENFVKHGEFSPALQPFMGATKIELGEGTLTPGTATRGALVSFPAIIYGADVLGFQHPSGIIRDRVGPPKVTKMVIRLEEGRRPPMQGCWLVREVLDVNFAFAGDMGNVDMG